MENNMNMENNMIVKTNEMFGDLRIIMVNEEPWFVGKDIAEKLGYSNASKAVIKHVDDEDKIKEMITHTINGNVVKTQTTLINESGLCSLILRSKLPSAKQFKRWITGEVLPSIRKYGGYIETTNCMSDEEILAKALVIAKKTIERNNKFLK